MPHARWNTPCLGIAALSGTAVAMIIGCVGNTPRHTASIEPKSSDVLPHGIETRGSSNAWVEFHGDANEMNAVFPSGVQPRHVDDSVDTPIGSQRIVRFIGNDGGQSLDAGYLVRSSNPLAALAGEKRILDSACEGTAKHVGGTVKSSNAITVGGYAARDIEISMPIDAKGSAGRHAVARLIITDDRIYHAIVCNVGDDESSRRAQEFINGLRPAGS